MRPHPRPLFISVALLSALFSLLVYPARAAEFDVPAVYATIQAAVDAAAASHDVLNNVNLTAPMINTFGAIDVGLAFGPTRRLTIRPKPGLARATIASKNGFEVIIIVHNASYVTIQDLDLVRNSTNKQHLVMLMTCERVILQRCRIGSNWASVGAAGYSNLMIDAPVNVGVRNCLFFSYLFGNFDNAVTASLGSGLNNSLFLYNNTASDYRVYGYEIGAHNGDQFVLLRNNVAVNRSGVAVEPIAYHSACSNVEVETSHNTAFAGAANVEEVEVGGISIAGDAASSFLRLNRADTAGSFVQSRWDVMPQWDPNPDFCRLLVGGPLHNEPSDAGQTVENGAPHARDVAVTDDWERTPRPNGFPEHTDRGADQILNGDVLIGIWSFKVSPSVLVGGGPNGTGLLVLTDFNYGPDMTVFLSSSNSAATVPASVIVAKGSNSVSFPVKTSPVTESVSGAIKARLAASTKSAPIKVRPVYVSKVTPYPTKVVGGTTSKATITLEIAAPFDTVVDLTSSNPAVAALPASITIPKGSISGGAAITTVKVPAVVYVKINAQANSGTVRSATLTVTP